MSKLLALLTISLIGFSACNKKVCQDPTGPCADTPPTNEACAAHFQRWFYNNNNNTCELISYSGCSQKGFETEAECVQSCVTQKKKK